MEREKRRGAKEWEERRQRNESVVQQHFLKKRTGGREEEEEKEVGEEGEEEKRTYLMFCDFCHTCLGHCTRFPLRIRPLLASLSQSFCLVISRASSSALLVLAVRAFGDHLCVCACVHVW